MNAVSETIIGLLKNIPEAEWSLYCTISPTKPDEILVGSVRYTVDPKSPTGFSIPPAHNNYNLEGTSPIERGLLI